MIIDTIFEFLDIKIHFDIKNVKFKDKNIGKHIFVSNILINFLFVCNDDISWLKTLHSIFNKIKKTEKYFIFIIYYYIELLKKLTHFECIISSNWHPSCSQSISWILNIRSTPSKYPNLLFLSIVPSIIVGTSKPIKLRFLIK